MLTRLVRVQLVIFTTMSIIGLAVMAVVYLQAPTFIGVGRITVTMKLPASGGLYRFSNVTYRGVQIGKVTDVAAARNGAVATMSLDTSPKIPADLQAQVRSLSAVGEQYVDLRPRTDSGPYLRDGSVIAMNDTTIPQQVGPMLDKVSALLKSIPKDKLSALLGETFKGLNGAGYDIGSLLDSSRRLSGDLNQAGDRTRRLFEDGEPLLDSQLQTTDAIRTWAHSLAGFTDQVVVNDAQVRAVLQKVPGAADEASRLLNQIKPTLPVLLANLTTVGQIGVTYHPAIQQLLVLLPPYIAATQSYALSKNNPTGFSLAESGVMIGDPPACTVGFLPPSAWRSPADTTAIDTPDGLYCKLPQDSPIAVRGARNYPCMGVPGKRAPTAQDCESDRPFVPLAQRQHVLGPYPIDPNLLAQGIPPDNRVNPDAKIYGPLQGTPLPPGALGAAPPPPPAAPAQKPLAPADMPLPSDMPQTPDAQVPLPGPANGGAPAAAPSSFVTGETRRSPSVAVVQYNPRTGEYLGPDGQAYRQTDLVPTAPRTWKDMMPI